MGKLTPYGFTAIESMVVVLVLVVAGIVVLVLHGRHNESSAQSADTVPVTSFATCRASATGHILDTYPVKCVAKDGTVYTNPDHGVNNPTN